MKPIGKMLTRAEAGGLADKILHEQGLEATRKEIDEVLTSKTGDRLSYFCSDTKGQGLGIVVDAEDPIGSFARWEISQEKGDPIVCGFLPGLELVRRKSALRNFNMPGGLQ